MPDFFVGPPGGALAGQILSEVPNHPGVSYYWGNVAPTPAAAAPTGTAASAATGANPLDTSYSIFGHNIPLSVFGIGRIGGELISGPWTDGTNVSGGISFGVPADPAGTRTLVEVAFNSEVIWTGNRVGTGTLDPGGFSAEPFNARWYDGTLTQPADALETAHFGAQANAYRPQMMLFIDTLPLVKTKFNRFPYVACKFSDGSGTDVNWGEAFARLAASPWVNFPAFEAIGITDGLPDGGLIITQDSEFLQLIQQVARFYNWDILQTDKLRIVDRGSTVTPDITLDATRLTGAISVTRQGPDTVAKDLELSTIDPASDYMIVPSLAQRPRDPVAVTTSIGKDTAYLPAIMDSSTRMSIVTYAKYREVLASKTISGTAMAYGLQIEPGDRVGISGLGDDFYNETFKVIETLHGANCTVEFTAAAFMDCGYGGDPDWDHVVLLLGFEDVDGSIGAPGFTDESSRHQGTSADGGTGAQIDTARFKFGSSSLRSNGHRIQFGSTTDWWLSTSNSAQFTVECWAYFNTLSTSQGEVLVGSSIVEFPWFLGVTTGFEIVFGFAPGLGGAVVNIISSAAAITTGAWYHIAADKDSTGKIRLYKNGVMMGSATPADSSFLHGTTYPLDIGGLGLFGGNLMDGWLDEIRITNGIARYKSDGGFSVPRSAFPRGGA